MPGSGKRSPSVLRAKRLGDRIELKIIDNGIGMKPETLKKMRSNTIQSDRLWFEKCGRTYQAEVRNGLWYSYW